MKAPILLFVYNRIHHLKQTIESLQKNFLANESSLIIYSDGPSNDKQTNDVECVRKFIKEIDGFKQIEIIERDRNWGLANNIIDGVTTQIKKFGKVIVLEDDLVTSPYFLQFMNDALDIYENETQIGHIQACDFTKDDKLPETFLIKWTGSWGWGTWKRAWDMFNPNGAYLLQELYKRKMTYTFDFNGTYKYTRMLKRQIQGKNDSWAIRWNASLFLNNILSLNVGKSLIQNKGYDGSGTNCGGGGLCDSILYNKRINVNKIAPITENMEARQIYIEYYKKNYSIKAKIIRRIKRTLKGDFSK